MADGRRIEVAQGVTLSGEADRALEAHLHPYLSRRTSSGRQPQETIDMAWTLLNTAAAMWLGLSRAFLPQSAAVFTKEHFLSVAEKAFDQAEKALAGRRS